jgi:hypothetical protein
MQNLINIIIITITVLLSSCVGVQQFTMPLPDSKMVIYVMGTNKSVFGGTDLRICDRWVYNPKTGETKLERSDSSSAENKSIIDSLKGVPIPLLIP